MTDSIYTPPSGPPQANAPQLYETMGMENLYAMAWEQYQRLGTSSIAAMFPVGEDALKEASQKQAEFLCGVLGGPKIYMQKYGHPRMRARHFPFAIDQAAQQEWLRCFQEALGDGTRWGLDVDQTMEFSSWITGFSAWMVNRGPE
jgi:hemoglobin